MSFFFDVFIFILYPSDRVRVRQECLGARGEDMRQRTMGRNGTRVARLQDGGFMVGLHALPSEPLGHPARSILTFTGNLYLLIYRERTPVPFPIVAETVANI